MNARQPRKPTCMETDTGALGFQGQIPNSADARDAGLYTFVVSLRLYSFSVVPVTTVNDSTTKNAFTIACPLCPPPPTHPQSLPGSLCGSCAVLETLRTPEAEHEQHSHSDPFVWPWSTSIPSISRVFDSIGEAFATVVG